MLELILKALLVYTVFGSITLLLLATVFGMSEILYYREVGKAKVKDKDGKIRIVDLIVPEPFLVKLLVSAFVIVAWPYFVTKMVK